MEDFFSCKQKNDILTIWSHPEKGRRTISKLLEEITQYLRENEIMDSNVYINELLDELKKEELVKIIQPDIHFDRETYNFEITKSKKFLEGGGFCKTLSLFQKQDVVLRWLIESPLAKGNVTHAFVFEKFKNENKPFTGQEIGSILEYISERKYLNKWISNDIAHYAISETGKIFWDNGKGGFENESIQESKMKEENNKKKNTIIIHGSVHGDVNQDTNYTLRTLADKESIKYPNKHAPILAIIKSFIVKVWEIIWFHPVPSSIIAAICCTFIIAFIKWKFKLTFLN